MRLVNLKSKVVLALVTAVVIAGSVPAQAEEKGFTLEDSIRNQIFLELKSNVENLYQNSRLLVPSIDTSHAARVASSSTNSGFVLPNNNEGYVVVKNKVVENIN
jgi:hypothetical protein